MKKTYSLFQIKQKKKNFLALCIRSSVLIAIPLLYYISSGNFNGNHNDIRQGKSITSDDSNVYINPPFSKLQAQSSKSKSRYPNSLFSVDSLPFIASMHDE